MIDKDAASPSDDLLHVLLHGGKVSEDRVIDLQVVLAVPEIVDGVDALLERGPARLVSVALANKAARIVWAILIRGETYREPTITRAAA
jgi:transposase